MQALLLIQTYLFKVDCEASYSNLYYRSRQLIPDEISSHRFKRSQSYPYMLCAKHGSIWYLFCNVCGMTRSGIEPTTSRLRGERSNHLATAAASFASVGLSRFLRLMIKEKTTTLNQFVLQIAEVHFQPICGNRSCVYNMCLKLKNQYSVFICKC